MYKDRAITKSLAEVLSGFPIVTITGPRQSGKTTLARKLFPEFDYVSLEDIDMREFAGNDPRGFLQRYPHKTIIDEFQRVPQLTSYLQTHVDNLNQSGMYILTGSNQFSMMNSLSQSLAGRTAIMNLLPFTYKEAYTENTATIEEIIFTGGYPRIFDKEINPTEFYSAYLETYVQRDVRLIENVKDLSIFLKFVKICASRTGQLVNYDSFSNELGVDGKTVKRWLSVLEASFIICLLQPYHANLTKRLVKSPKLYFLDTGLVSYLLGISQREHLLNHPLKGELFETFIFTELLKHINNNRIHKNILFYRDNNQREIDFVIEDSNRLKLIEVKLTSTPGMVNFKNLNKLKDVFGKETQTYLVYGGEDNSRMYNSSLVSYRSCDRVFSENPEWHAGNV